MLGINDKNPRLIEWADVYNMIRLVSRLRLNTEKARFLLAEGNEGGYILVERTFEEIQMGRVEEARKAIKEANGVQGEI